jgi:hypothetical protein
MFYGGANVAVDANVFRTHDWDAASRLIDDALGLMGAAKAWSGADVKSERSLA